MSGALRVVAATASRALADAVATGAGSGLASSQVERFPDGELRPAVDGAMGGVDRLVDPHTTALEAMFPIPVETLTAVPTLADRLGPSIPGDAVVVAPDVGGVKLAEAYASRLGCPVAVVRKTRLSGEAVRAEELVGDVKGRPAIILDEMISTGATIEAAARMLIDGDAIPDITVVATHGLFVGDAAGRLANLPLRRLVVTDGLDLVGDTRPPPELCSIAPLLADAIGRLHRRHR
ncbi:MAG TPA: ribose-phosphate diphosphokinase, partial [Acidimicrobiales bacterium]|nr:ribose-phosphate diphosphokinase [Acidimicrobiales bacterium]